MKLPIVHSHRALRAMKLSAVLLAAALVPGAAAQAGSPLLAADQSSVSNGSGLEIYSTAGTIHQQTGANAGIDVTFAPTAANGAGFVVAGVSNMGAYTQGGKILLYQVESGTTGLGQVYYGEVKTVEGTYKYTAVEKNGILYTNLAKARAAGIDVDSLTAQGYKVGVVKPSGGTISTAIQSAAKPTSVTLGVRTEKTASGYYQTQTITTKSSGVMNATAERESTTETRVQVGDAVTASINEEDNTLTVDINGDKLTYSGVHYFGVNDGGSTWGNHDNTGATGFGAIAVGPDASAAGAGSVAIGSGASVTVEGGVAVGWGSASSRAAGLAGANPLEVEISAAEASSPTWRSTAGAFSIGGTLPDGTVVTRQVTGVAAGTEDTDAVNVAQLRGSGTHYYGVNTDMPSSGDAPTTGNDNKNNSGATGAASLAAGFYASASGEEATALGYSSESSQKSSSSLGSLSKATAPYATAVGHAAAATGANSTAVGTDTIADGTFSAAVGLAAKAYGEGAIAIGHETTAGALVRVEQVSGQGAGAVYKTVSLSQDIDGQEYIFLNRASASGSSALAAYNTETRKYYAAVPGADGKYTLGEQLDEAEVSMGGIAVGSYAHAAGDRSLSVGRASGAYGTNSTAIGIYANATGEGSMAIGHGTLTGVKATINSGGADDLWTLTPQTDELGNPVANGAIGGIAIGSYAHTEGDRALAVGRVAGAYGIDSMAVGLHSNAYGEGSMAFGHGVTAGNADDPYAKQIAALHNDPQLDYDLDGNDEYGVQSGNVIGAIALGSYAEATGRGSLSVGRYSKADSAYSTALGIRATVSSSASNAVAIGRETTVAGENSIAIGKQAAVTGHDSIAIGTGHTVTGSNSGAFGDPSVIEGNNSYAVGNNNTIGTFNGAFILGNDSAVSANDGIVLGSSASVTAEGGVALGKGSTAATAAGVAGYDPTTGEASTQTSAAWRSSASAVSVGGNGVTRQITNVAAGT